MEYVWGDSINYAFDPAKTITSEKYIGGGGNPVDPDNPNPGVSEEIIYTANFKATDGDCTFDVTTDPKEGVNLWNRSKAYGWMATGAVKEGTNKYPTKFAADGSLLLPVFDLTDFESIELNFNHAVNYDKSPTIRLVLRYVAMALLQKSTTSTGLQVAIGYLSTLAISTSASTPARRYRLPSITPVTRLLPEHGRYATLPSRARRVLHLLVSAASAIQASTLLSTSTNPTPPTICLAAASAISTVPRVLSLSSRMA